MDRDLLTSGLFTSPRPVFLQAGDWTLGHDLTAIFVFTLFGIVFVVVTVALISRILRPRALPEEEPAKKETYECGEPAIGSSWVRFDIRFYTVALIFLVFDVEVAFLYPWAVIFRPLRQVEAGTFVFFEMLIFVAILLVGFVYCWSKGDLDWVKSQEAQADVELPPVEEAPAERGAEEKALAAR